MAADCGPTCYKGPLAVYSVARREKDGRGRGGGEDGQRSRRKRKAGRQAGRQAASV